MYFYKTTVSGVSLTASTAETMIQLSTPSTSRCAVWGWKFSFNGTTATDDPILCDVLRQTTLGAGSGGTEEPIDPNAPASLTVATITYATEPTAGAVLDAAYVHPQGGFWEEQLAKPILLDVSDFVGFRVTPQAITVAHEATVTVLYEN